MAGIDLRVASRPRDATYTWHVWHHHWRSATTAVVGPRSAHQVVGARGLLCGRARAQRCKMATHPNQDMLAEWWTACKAGELSSEQYFTLATAYMRHTELKAASDTPATAPVAGTVRAHAIAPMGLPVADPSSVAATNCKPNAKKKLPLQDFASQRDAASKSDSVHESITPGKIPNFAFNLT
eukprot:SAG31_NODE_2177_length_6252_cov_4.841378_2_plen_182_part_00